MPQFERTRDVIARAIYRAFSWLLLPSAFRDEYGAEMEDAVAARVADRGTLGTVGVLLAECADLVATAWRERRGKAPETGESMRETLTRSTARWRTACGVASASWAYAWPSAQTALRCCAW